MVKTMKNTLFWTNVDSPQGEVIILATEKEIVWASTPGTTLEKAEKWAKKHLNAELQQNDQLPVLKTARKELEDYFAGKRIDFTGPFLMHGTEFQKDVWNEMLKIPYGKTKTYGQVAQLIGRTKAVRALGGACGANPIAIHVPCHRVVGSNGSLTGYGGGLPTKKWLLQLELDNS